MLNPRYKAFFLAFWDNIKDIAYFIVDPREWVALWEDRTYKDTDKMIDASNNAMGVNPKGKLKDVYSAKENEESERL